MLLDTLAANVLENMLRGKTEITDKSRWNNVRAGDGRIRAGRDF